MFQNTLWLDKEILHIPQEKATSATENAPHGAKVQITQLHRRECGNATQTACWFNGAVVQADTSSWVTSTRWRLNRYVKNESKALLSFALAAGGIGGPSCTVINKRHTRVRLGGRVEKQWESMDVGLRFIVSARLF